MAQNAAAKSQTIAPSRVRAEEVFRDFSQPWLDLNDKSITEAEFDWARDLDRPMAIFIPDRTKDFAVVLEGRTGRQTESEARAQLAFLDRVKSIAACQLFDDMIDLSIRVTRKTVLWAQGGLRGLAAQAPSLPAPKARPSDDEIAQLGRRTLVRSFEDSLDSLTGPGLPNAACFLVHGPGGYGQKEIVRRLRQIVEQSSNVQPKQYQVAVGAAWQHKSLAKLIEVIGARLRPEWQPASPGELAGQLAKELAISDVVLEIADLHRLELQLPDFVQAFWMPIVAALGAPLQRRLIVFLSMERQAPGAWDACLSQPDDPAALISERPVKLPALIPFAANELAPWLQKWLPPNEAKVLADILMDETQGNPQLLYNKLYDNLTWIR